jgi:hypothetical protein
MRHIKFISFLLLLFSISGVFAQIKIDTLNNKSLVELRKVNLSNEVIKIKINNSFCQFDLSVEGLLFLKKSGISDDVIAEMFKKNNQENNSSATLNASSVKNTAKDVSRSNQSDTIQKDIVFVQEGTVITRSGTITRYEKLSQGVYYIADDNKKYHELVSVDESVGEKFDDQYRNSFAGGVGLFTPSSSTLVGLKSSVEIDNSNPTFYIVTHGENKITGAQLSTSVDIFKAKVTIWRKFNFNKKFQSSFPTKIKDDIMKVKFSKLTPGSYVLRLNERTLAKTSGRGLALPKYYEFDIK